MPHGYHEYLLSHPQFLFLFVSVSFHANKLEDPMRSGWSNKIWSVNDVTNVKYIFTRITQVAKQDDGCREFFK